MEAPAVSQEEHNRNAYLAAFGTLHPTDRRALQFAAQQMPELAPFQFKKQAGRHFLFCKEGEMMSGRDNFSAVVNSHLAYVRLQQKGIKIWNRQAALRA